MLPHLPLFVRLMIEGHPSILLRTQYRVRNEVSSNHYSAIQPLPTLQITCSMKIILRMELMQNQGKGSWTNSNLWLSFQLRKDKNPKVNSHIEIIMKQNLLLLFLITFVLWFSRSMLGRKLVITALQVKTQMKISNKIKISKNLKICLTSQLGSLSLTSLRRN